MTAGEKNSGNCNFGLMMCSMLLFMCVLVTNLLGKEGEDGPNKVECDDGHEENHFLVE